MDRTRIATAIVGALTAAIAGFAVGTAMSSDRDIGGGAAAPAPTTAASGAGDTTGDTTGDGSAPASAAGTFAIEIVDFAFGPQDAVVPVGTEVVWTNNDGTEHSILPSGGSFEASPTLGTGDSFSFVFTEPGTYDYICGIHPATMAGTITVEG